MDSVSQLIEYFKNVLGVHHILNENNSVPEGDYSQGVTPEQFFRYLIIHELPEQETGKQEARELLQKMLEALKWNPQIYQTQEVSRFADATDTQQKIVSFPGEKVFLFVHEPRKIQVSFQDSSTFIFLQSPWTLIQDPQLKRQVWNMLKPYVSESAT